MTGCVAVEIYTNHCNLYASLYMNLYAYVYMYVCMCVYGFQQIIFLYEWPGITGTAWAGLECLITLMVSATSRVSRKPIHRNTVTVRKILEQILRCDLQPRPCVFRQLLT